MIDTQHKLASVGQTAPDFSAHAIVDGRIKDISLSTYIEAHHWLVLVFFPKAWSYICPTEIRSFSARLEEFLYTRSCAVAFVSTDSEFCLRAWNNTSELEGGLGGVHVPLVSDSNHKLSKSYGVLNEEEGTAQRALFIIDPKGIIRAMTINDVDVGRSVDEVQRSIDAMTFKDEFGEGCPVNWKKGDEGIDITTKSKIEGAVEIEARKSWTDWARPKLTRAFSGNSQRSIAPSMVPSIISTALSSSRMPSADGSTLPTLGSLSLHDHQRPHSMHLSPLSPTSIGKFDGQLENAHVKAELQKQENERAAAHNSERPVGAAM